MALEAPDRVLSIIELPAPSGRIVDPGHPQENVDTILVADMSRQLDSEPVGLPPLQDRLGPVSVEGPRAASDALDPAFGDPPRPGTTPGES